MKRTFLLALLSGLWIGMFAGPVTIDLSSLEIRKYRIHGDGIDETFTNNNPQNISLTENRDYLIDLSPNGQLVCQLSLFLRNNGQWGTIQWRINGIDAFVALPASYYSLSTNGKEVGFSGVTTSVDLQGTDHGMARMPALKNEGTANGESGISNNNYSLFPGAYRLKTGEGKTLIEFTLGLDGNLVDSLKFRAKPGSVWKPLNSDCYVVNAQSLELIGQPIEMVVNPGASNQILCQHWKMNGALTPGHSATYRVLPGQHCFGVQAAGETASLAMVMLEVDNETSRVSPEAEWMDVEGGRTNGEFEVLEAGALFIESSKVVIDNDLPPAEVSLGPGPYATLKDQLDESYYPAYYGKLWVKYDERYAEGGNLDIRVFDLQDQAISLAAVAKEFGANWLKLTLPNTDFAAGEFYILEVRNAHGDLGTLKFQYK